MVRENIFSRMDKHMKVTLRKIKSMVMVNVSTKMVTIMRANGFKATCMDKEYLNLNYKHTRAAIKTT